MSDATDLFGNGPAQLNLFGEGAGQMQAPARAPIDHPARARARLTAVLEAARAARAMHRSERDARMWQAVFPQMANWLPEDEARQMVLDFEREIARLSAA
jgi:hypothetical protein